jgi:hypothetical protein
MKKFIGALCISILLLVTGALWYVAKNQPTIEDAIVSSTLGAEVEAYLDKPGLSNFKAFQRPRRGATILYVKGDIPNPEKEYIKIFSVEAARLFDRKISVEFNPDEKLEAERPKENSRK